MKQRSYAPIPVALHYAKAALPLVPVLSRLPQLRRHETVSPNFAFTRSNVSVKPDHLDRYREVCGFEVRNTLPVTYMHMGAFAMHMALMNDASFPFTPMGLVHLRNSITQHRPINHNERWNLKVWAENMRLHPKGQLIDIRTDAHISGETVWEETTTLLHRSNTGGADLSSPDFVELQAGTTRWDLPKDLGRRYGAVSSDRNPIHLYPVTARAFGFKTAIAHGMWTKAKSLAALDSALPESFNVDVEFQKPIFLPNTVVFNTDGDNFAVHARNGEVTHLLGHITKLAD